MYLSWKMKDEIIEIINIMIQEILDKGKMTIEEEKMINDLVDLGYSIKDIDRALELIFSSPEIIDAEIENYSDTYNRIFTRTEKMYLTLELQGVIRRLMILNVLSPEESESLITKTVKNSFKGATKTRDLWNILEEIIKDKSRLDLISQEIPEFNDYFYDDYKYIN